MIEKQCGACGETKPASDFYTDRRLKDGLTKNCRACVIQSAGAWAANNREKAAQRKRDWVDRNPQRASRLRQMRLYSVTEEQLDTEVVCRICGATENLHWDHSHETGVTRGRLCGPCNRGLGMFKDRVALLQNAIDYLEKRL